jgi:formamidopyrimidine-DNA glycosylase
LPELPEVETTARGLREVLVGRQLLGIFGIDWPRMLPNSTADELASALPGRFVSGVARRGKYLLLELSGELALAFHRKMSGNLLLLPAGAPLPRHAHFAARFEGELELVFVDPRKFGRVYFFRSVEEREAFLVARLGPDPLEGLSEQQLRDALRGRRRRLKALLLDQRFLAGLGNLYIDEALWAARLHPLRLAAELTRPEVRRLYAGIVEVLQSALARRGTSLSDYLDASGEPGATAEAVFPASAVARQFCARSSPSAEPHTAHAASASRAQGNERASQLST